MASWESGSSPFTLSVTDRNTYTHTAPRSTAGMGNPWTLCWIPIRIRQHSQWPEIMPVAVQRQLNSRRFLIHHIREQCVSLTLSCLFWEPTGKSIIFILSPCSLCDERKQNAEGIIYGGWYFSWRDLLAGTGWLEWSQFFICRKKESSCHSKHRISRSSWLLVTEGNWVTCCPFRRSSIQREILSCSLLDYKVPEHTSGGGS